VAAALSQPAAAQPAAQPAAPPAAPSCDPESLTVPVADSRVELMATIFGRIVPDSDARLMAASVGRRGSREWWEALRNPDLPLWGLALQLLPNLAWCWQPQLLLAAALHDCWSPHHHAVRKLLAALVSIYHDRLHGGLEALLRLVKSPSRKGADGVITTQLILDLAKALWEHPEGLKHELVPIAFAYHGRLVREAGLDELARQLQGYAGGTDWLEMYRRSQAAQSPNSQFTTLAALLVYYGKTVAFENRVLLGLAPEAGMTQDCAYGNGGAAVMGGEARAGLRPAYGTARGGSVWGDLHVQAVAGKTFSSRHIAKQFTRFSDHDFGGGSFRAGLDLKEGYNGTCELSASVRFETSRNSAGAISGSFLGVAAYNIVDILRAKRYDSQSVGEDARAGQLPQPNPSLSPAERSKVAKAWLKNLAYGNTTLVHGAVFFVCFDKPVICMDGTWLNCGLSAPLLPSHPPGQVAGQAWTAQHVRAFTDDLRAEVARVHPEPQSVDSLELLNASLEQLRSEGRAAEADFEHLIRYGIDRLPCIDM